MYLSDIKIVDLRFSKWNEEKSDPKDGNYDFTEKVYVNLLGSKKVRSPWFFTWCRYDPRNNYQEFRDWRYDGYSAVNVDKDEFWPEPLAPNNDGNYVFKDVICVKRSLVDELKYRLEKQSRNTSARSKIEAFQEELRRKGAGVSDSMLKELLGG